MKITAIIPDSISTPVGGMGEQFKNTYKYLKEDVEINIVGYPDKDYKEPNYVGAKNPIPEASYGPLTALLGQVIYFKEALKFGKPDIVHAYDWTTYMAGYCLAKHFDVPLLLSMQLSVNGLASQNIFNCGDPSTIDGHLLQKYQCQIEDFVLKNADKVICVSQAYTKYLPQETEGKTIVIPNGISLSKWDSKADVVFPGKNKYKIVYIGRFASMKGVQHLLEANVPQDIDLILVGSTNGGDAEVMQKIDPAIKDNNNIHYVGPIYGQEKIDMLNGADAVIVPSIHEPFGIVALEALASKSILLSSRVDGMGDFLDDKNSIIVPPGSYGIEKAFNDFLQLKDSQKKDMIKEGLKTCKAHDWKNISKQYLEVYKSFI